MILHRNSQKRIYVDRGIYFITTNTHNGCPFFGEDLFCDLFVEELELCRELKGFDMYGYKINPDHVHLLIQPGEKYDFSSIIHFLKRNFSQNVNKIIGKTQWEKPRSGKTKQNQPSNKGENAHSRLCWGFDEVVKQCKQQFIGKYGNKHKFPPFKWQKSFHFHIINNRRDFYAHLRYIQNQWIRHGLEENKYCYVGAMPF